MDSIQFHLGSGQVMQVRPASSDESVNEARFGACVEGLGTRIISAALLGAMFVPSVNSSA